MAGRRRKKKRRPAACYGIWCTVNIGETVFWTTYTKLLSFFRDNEARILSIKLTIDLNGKLLLFREMERESERTREKEKERERAIA